MLRLFRERMRGQPGRGAGRDDLSTARRGFQRFRSEGAKRDAVEGDPKKGRGTSVGFDFRVRPGGAKQKRGFGRRTGVEVARLLSRGSGRWEATPELVSRSSEVGSPGIRFWDLADPSLGAVGAGSNAGPHFICAADPRRSSQSQQILSSSFRRDQIRIRALGNQAAALTLSERAREGDMSCSALPR